MLPWFQSRSVPLYLAPMAGVTDLVFRTLCKELGADVMVTEFVSAEGVIRQDERTRRYTEFTDGQRPVGVQLFGADGERMGEAARKITAWKRPDFIDLNFGCPVNKVVAKNGGSSLLRDCPLLAATARAVVAACAPVGVPVTGKIRTGWDAGSVNAPDVCRLLEDCGVEAVAVHGRTRAQGYSGEADWEVIARCAGAVSVPVIGNGDIASGADVARRVRETGVRGLMIGRAAMQNPWVFREAKHFLEHGDPGPQATLRQRWDLARRHARMAVAWGRYGDERQTVQAMRARLMAYSRGMPEGKRLRTRLSTVASLAELDGIARCHLEQAPPAGGILVAAGC
ncbi:MAG TPA: tRNA dihydrouridine synthase DusB [Gemmatimonadales bacterium]|nr:tRNA dihydrouridine synthase DusB [Gemmatimonadales bacterium]